MSCYVLRYGTGKSYCAEKGTGREGGCSWHVVGMTSRADRSIGRLGTQVGVLTFGCRAACLIVMVLEVEVVGS